MSKNQRIMDARAKTIQKAIDRGISDALSAFTKDVPKQVTTRSKLGGGVQKANKDGYGGQRIKFAPLSERYKDVRRKYRSKLSQDTSVSKSNLTATGQLLESLKGRKKPGDVLEVFASGNRTKELDGSSSTLSNEQVLEKVEGKRPFLGLTDAEVNKFQREARKIIQRKLDKALD